MAEYKAKLLNGLFTKAKNVLLKNGASVENMCGDSGWTTIDSYIRYRKIGKVVYIEANVPSTAISTGTWTTFGSVANGYKPNTMIIIDSYNDGTYFSIFRVNTDGSVQGIGSAGINVCVSYLTD